MHFGYQKGPACESDVELDLKPPKLSALSCDLYWANMNIAIITRRSMAIIIVAIIFIVTMGQWRRRRLRRRRDNKQALQRTERLVFLLLLLITAASAHAALTVAVGEQQGPRLVLPRVLHCYMVLPVQGTGSSISSGPFTDTSTTVTERRSMLSDMPSCEKLKHILAGSLPAVAPARS